MIGRRFTRIPVARVSRILKPGPPPTQKPPLWHHVFELLAIGRLRRPLAVPGLQLCFLSVEWGRTASDLEDYLAGRVRRDESQFVPAARDLTGV